MCVGCRERATTLELIRVVAGSDDHGPAVVPDLDGTAPGRGAHLHPTPACLALAVRRRAFPRALRFAGGLDVTALSSLIDTSTDTTP
ncbi:YlxR family protein [Nocardioides sp. JQ2195]|uniref:YlxR family protein n=1 Tax=Nocardioides sp. JQ2195 TaxID=2592334 RepID=UPI001F0D8A97|nr:YlxR family protein [Nocardioides sp. JQ2195]